MNKYYLCVKFGLKSFLKVVLCKKRAFKVKSAKPYKENQKCQANASKYAN